MAGSGAADAARRLREAAVPGDTPEIEHAARALCRAVHRDLARNLAAQARLILGAAWHRRPAAWRLPRSPGARPHG